MYEGGVVCGPVDCFQYFSVTEQSFAQFIAPKQPKILETRRIGMSFASLTGVTVDGE